MSPYLHCGRRGHSCLDGLETRAPETTRFVPSPAEPGVHLCEELFNGAEYDTTKCYVGVENNITLQKVKLIIPSPPPSLIGGHGTIAL